MKRTELQRRTPMRRAQQLRAQRSRLQAATVRRRTARLRTTIARPNAAQKRWRERVRESGTILGGLGPIHVHHCAGRTARHDGIHIGHWWILPLTEYQHRSIHADPDRKGREKHLWLCLLARLPLLDEDPQAYPPAEVCAAIQDYHR